MAITGKPLAATAGARMFEHGGNAVDAACAMLAATSTMWDVLSWGGETQALIYNPKTGKIIAINGLGVAPTGATAEFFKSKGYKYPPEEGPLAAVTPGTPGALITMLSEFGTLSLADVLAPSIELADGYAIEAETADRIEAEKASLKQWPYAKAVMLPHAGAAREAPVAGEIFRQADLAATLRKLVEAEAKALKAGKSRKEALAAAYDRFYRGDIGAGIRARRARTGRADHEGRPRELAREARGAAAHDLPRHRRLQAGPLDAGTGDAPGAQHPRELRPQVDGLQQRELHPHRLPGAEPRLRRPRLLLRRSRLPARGADRGPALEGLREAARGARESPSAANDGAIGPGDPYPFQGGTNPYEDLLDKRAGVVPAFDAARFAAATDPVTGSFYRGTTSVIAADKDGWLVSMTPSGGWLPAVIAGRTGIGMSQRAQMFVTDPAENPFNVVEPGKRPRVTLTPSLAFKDGKPWLAFAVQGGDTQDQNLLQFFLDVVEFGMTPQQAAEAPNFNSWQMHDSFGEHEIFPGRILLNDSIPDWVRRDLKARGYKPEYASRTSGPINAILIDPVQKTFWGGSSNHGEDYGIAW